ncbi:MAG: hypothetical protein QOE33_2469 [Acidobacteriota bacterium]|nr:hypothetical protein [Acidobacteriota bacterium]
MKKKALVFVPHNPCPPRTGAHKRYLETISGLRALGFHVTVALSTFTTDSEITQASVEALRADFADDVRVHVASDADRRFVSRLEKFYELDYLSVPIVRRLYPLGSKRTPPVSSRIYSPPGMRRWFRELAGEIGPDLIFINYAYWDSLVDHHRWRDATTIIETIDLTTLNRKMWRALESRLPPAPIDPADVPEEVLREDFYARLDLVASPEEFGIYDKYTYTLAISEHEAGVIARNTRRTKVVYLPMTQEAQSLANTYDGSALLTTGPNPFNTQGYLYFIRRVLPLVRAAEPSFDLFVTGYCCERVLPVEGVTHGGFVPDIATVYASSRFFVSPVFGGTGQQVKIVEAMAHGLPVVALRDPAARSPIRHGENGLVADNAEEFAAHVLRLWRDPALCRQLGEAARAIIRRDFSRERLLEDFSVMAGSHTDAGL